MTARSSVLSGQGFEGMPELPVKQLSRKSSCLMCYAGGDVLVCSHGDCPIVVHKSCMSCAAWLNDSGSFCCPYCVYKRSLIECHQAKQQVLMAKNALLGFLDMTMGNTGNPENSKSKKRPNAATGMQNRTNSTCIRKETTKAACQTRWVEGGQEDGNFKFSELLATGPPERYSSWGRETIAEEFESLTKKAPENLHKVELGQCGSDGSNEQMEKDPEETLGCLNKMDTTTHVKSESKTVNFSPIQDDLFASFKEVNSDNAEEFAEVGNRYSRADERQKNVACLMGDESVLVTDGELGNLTEEHQEKLNSIEGLHEGAEKIQKHSDPHETSKYFTGKHDIMKRHEQYNMETGNVAQDNYFVGSQMEVHPVQPIDIGEGLCDYEWEMLVKSHTSKDIVSMTNLDSGNLTMERQEIAMTVERLHTAGTVNKQILAEAQERSVYLNKKENTTELSKECDGNDGTYEGKCYATSQMEVNLENANHLAQNIEDHTRKDNRQILVESPTDVLQVMRKSRPSVANEESGIVTKINQQIGEKAEKYHDGGAEKAHSQLDENGAMRMHETSDKENGGVFKDSYFARLDMELNSWNADQPAEIGDYQRLDERQKAKLQKTFKLKTSDGAMRMHETSDKENGGVFKDSYFVRLDMELNSWNADQPAEIGDYQRLDERQKAKLPTDDVRCMEHPAIHEQSDNGNNSVSTEGSCCGGHGVSSKRKRQMPKSFKNDNQSGDISKTAENEFSEVEEYEIVAHSKSGKKVASVKRMKRSVLYSARRRKLPWTAEEVEMLKEGVQKFALAAKKKLPWVKILEFGCHIFDGTRTPVDLKDKWRNITGKLK